MVGFVNIVAEGELDAAVGTQLLHSVGLEVGTIHVKRGKTKIDGNITGYNQAAAFSPWLVLRDLDRDAECTPELIRQILPDARRDLLLRIPVRSIETWLFADADGIAKYLGFSRAIIPNDPEGLVDPKGALVQLARRSRKREMREGIVPSPRSGRRAGVAYPSLMLDFAKDHWSMQRAIDAQRADSLNRALAALERLAARRQPK